MTPRRTICTATGGVGCSREDHVRLSVPTPRTTASSGGLPTPTSAQGISAEPFSSIHETAKSRLLHTSCWKLGRRKCARHVERANYQRTGPHAEGKEKTARG